MNRKILSIFLYSFSFFFLFLSHADAFGPVTHVNLGCEILSSLSLLPAALARLLTTHPHEYLYGNMAADVIMAKSLASEEKHCHNWHVGFSVLEEATGPAQEAFAWGYLSHLAADVVAHNYFVPHKLVESYSARTTGHQYWEVRLDQKASPSIWRLVDRLSRQKFTEHHGLLSRTIEGTIFNFETNLTIFNGWIFLQRFKRWRWALDHLDRRSRWILSESESEKLLQMAVSSILDLLLKQNEGLTFQGDPTGHQKIKTAKTIRRALRRKQSKSPLANPELETLLDGVHDHFKQHIFLPHESPPIPQALQHEISTRRRIAS